MTMENIQLLLLKMTLIGLGISLAYQAWRWVLRQIRREIENALKNAK